MAVTGNNFLVRFQHRPGGQRSPWLPPLNQYCYSLAMATFIFRLARDASENDIARVSDELGNRFPQHRFIGNGDGLRDVEFDIMPANDPARKSSWQTDPAEIDMVKHAFFSMLDGWG